MAPLSLCVLATLASTATAFITHPLSSSAITAVPSSKMFPVVPSSESRRTQLHMTESTEKMAPVVTGAELETMLQDWDMPLVVDAYATWCGPCLLMAPEFEQAAQDLAGRVRFVKIDTDLEPEMAARLSVMGLPTLLFLAKNDDTEAVEEGKAPMAVLKERIEGALRKDSIKDVCEYHFFGGPMPTNLS